MRWVLGTKEDGINLLNTIEHTNLLAAVMANFLLQNQDIIKLNDPQNFFLWCVQVWNSLWTKRYE